MERRYFKWLGFSLFVLFWGMSGSQAQKVVYRDYGRLGWTILDSLKRPGATSLFKGMSTLNRECQTLAEGTPVDMKACPAGKRELKPGEIVEKRRESVLMMFKYSRATTRPEAIEPWATAVVLSEDGVCVTNWHVFWQLIDTAARLDLRDSLLFVATEAGKVYSITSILSYSRSGDLAFFKIDSRGDRLVPMPIGQDIAVGENVYALTNPAGYPYVYTTGVVSRTFTKEAGNPFGNRVEITADFAKGSSGGPIMDDRGNMIAIVSCLHPIYYVDQQPTDRQMGIKECIPVSSIVRLMGKEQVVKAGNGVDTTELKKGDKCPEFVFKDAQGKEHSLSELKGKYVFIDVWASWCYPCRKEYPYLQELEKKMEGKNIVFIGISCDHIEWRWTGALEMGKMGGVQWWIAGNESFLKAFRADRIPRFILLDPKGRVLELNMTRPSDSETEKYLLKLKKI